MVSQQHTYGLVFRIAGDHVKPSVSIYIAHGQSPCSPARRERRVGRCFEAAASVTEHDANSITCCGNHVCPAITIHIRQDYMVGVVAHVERGVPGFSKTTCAIAEQRRQFVLLMMRNHEIGFAITIDVADCDKPRFTRSHWNLTRLKTTASITQEQRQRVT